MIPEEAAALALAAGAMQLGDDNGAKTQYILSQVDLVRFAELVRVGSEGRAELPPGQVLPPLPY